jgi:hypothetical protein
MNKYSFDDFDDELDDDYNTNNMSTQQVDNLVNTLSTPDNSEQPSGVIDEKTMNQLLNQVQNMPKAKLQQYLKQLTGKDNFNNSVISNNHTTTRDKLRKKLAEKKRNIKSKTVKKTETCISNKHTELRDIDDIMKDIESVNTKSKKKNKKKKNKK